MITSENLQILHFLLIAIEITLKYVLIFVDTPFISALVPVFHFYPQKEETKNCGFLIIPLSQEYFKLMLYIKLETEINVTEKCIISSVARVKSNMVK